jgi:hypothetical protein
MNIDPYKGTVTATKNETRRFVEARILADATCRQIDELDPEAIFWGQLANDLKRAAQLIGAKHLTPQGYLKETAAEARVNDGVPG